MRPAWREAFKPSREGVQNRKKASRGRRRNSTLPIYLKRPYKRLPKRLKGVTYDLL